MTSIVLWGLTGLLQGGLIIGGTKGQVGGGWGGGGVKEGNRV